MVFKRPSATAALSADVLAKAEKQIANQEISTSAPRTADPNFPLFRIPAGEKVYMYIPNHKVTDEDGVSHLREDTPFFHQVHPDSRTFTKLRCINGIEIEGTGFDGTCPACELSPLAYQIANTIIESECNKRGLSTNDQSQEVKDIKRNAYSDMKIGSSTRGGSHTFPIVIFEREQYQENGRNKARFITDENGKPVYNVSWYTVTERTWTKFEEALAAAENEDGEVPDMAGSLFLVSYGTKDENGNPPNLRDAARDMTVAYKPAGNLSAVLPEIDKATEEWTPTKAREVLYDNNIYEPSAMRESLAELADQMQRELDLLSGSLSGAPAASLDSLTGGASEVPAVTASAAPAAPAAPANAISAGLVDEDDDED